MARSTHLYALLVVLGISSYATAQSPVLAELYGRGVHAYNSGNYEQAHKYLSMAIDNGSRDPRVYYFRGVVHSATGRTDEATDDWTEGAKLESQGEFGLAIGRALQRIQGSVRIEMENIRQMVRLESRADQAAKANARYNDLKAAESEVLRGGASSAPSIAAPSVAAPPVADAGNPFGDDAPAAGQPVPDEQNNPFNDDPVGGAPAAPAAGGGTPANDPFGGAPAGGADPFGGAPAGGAPAADPFGGAPAGGAPADDPFGGGAPAPAGGAPAADPFGGGAPAGGAPAADPFGGGAPAGGAPAGGADPFGGGAAEPAGATPAAPAAGGGADPFGADPFGGGAPAGGAPAGGGEMNSDPFGGDPFGS